MSLAFPLGCLFLTIIISPALGRPLVSDYSRQHVARTSSGLYSKAAVATDAGVCSEIGAGILKKGGNAVDAAISSLLCVGVVNLHSTGIGGGGYMIFYQSITQKLYALDYREVAPRAASFDMYDGLGPTASTLGGLF